MKYVLLGYDSEALEELAPEEKRAFHAAHRALHEVAGGGNVSVNVTAHYRFRPARLAKTLRFAGDNLVTAEGPAAETSNALRALYLLESDDPDAVLEFASHLPALRAGGRLEVWPLTEPTDASSRGSR